ncbi:MAG: FAD-binding protein [bacterium]
MATNWAGNLEYSTDRIAAPRTEEELQHWVAVNPKLRALGTRHSFNQIADSKHLLLSLEHLNKIAEPEPLTQTVTVQGGVTYSQLAKFLHSRGWALHNLASLPHISVAGAVATATHGSGYKNGNLATAVTGIKIVGPGGKPQSLTKQDKDFNQMVVNLGALGVVTKLTIRIEPRYQVAQWVYRDLPLQALADNFLEVRTKAYSVSLFTHWRSSKFEQVWLKERCPAQAPDEWLGMKKADEKLHPIEGIGTENCTDQGGEPGDWHDRLPHFRMDFLPSAGEELQSEYFVPVGQAVDALFAIDQIAPQITDALLISEIRFIAKDDLLMSPCCHQDCIGIHFTWKKDWPRVRALLPLVETALAPYQPRPHWGKLFHAVPSCPAEFKELVLRRDPEGKFANGFIRALLRTP